MEQVPYLMQKPFLTALLAIQLESNTYQANSSPFKPTGTRGLEQADLEEAFPLHRIIKQKKKKTTKIKGHSVALSCFVVWLLTATSTMTYASLVQLLPPNLRETQRVQIPDLTSAAGTTLLLTSVNELTMDSRLNLPQSLLKHTVSLNRIQN